MAESELHRTMKSTVRKDLEREGFTVIEEPLFSPSRRVHWSGYRPDLIGYRRTHGLEELTFVECETHPNPRRFRRKNFASIWFQPYLLCQGNIRYILAVPRGTLTGVDMRLRGQWEIWVLGRLGPICKIGVLEREESWVKERVQTVAAASL